MAGTIISESYISFLNLDHRLDRLESMQAELYRIGISAERTRGKLPHEYDLSDLKVGAMRNFGIGAVGCYYGQVEIMKKALSENKCAFVMEDDIIFCDDFFQRMEIAQDFLNKQDWDILWLGGTYSLQPYWHKRGDGGSTWMSRSVSNAHANVDLRMCHCDKNADWEETDNPRIRRTYGCWSTYAYIVNVVSISKILALLDENIKYCKGIDHCMILLEPQLNTFAFNPGMVKQYSGASDTCIGTYNNFEEHSSSLGPHWWAKNVDS